MAASSGRLKFSFYSPAYIDDQTQLFLLLVIYLTLRRSYLWLLPVLVLGTMQKESLAAFALFPAARIWRERAASRSGRAIVLGVAAMVLPALTLALIHRSISGTRQAGPTLVIRSQLLQLLAPRYWPVLLQSVFSGLGILPIFLFLRTRSGWRFLRREWEWIVYGLLALLLLLGGVDKARLFLYFLPLAVILAARSASSIEAISSPARYRLWVLDAVIVQLYLGGYLLPMGPFSSYLARWVPEHAIGHFYPYLLQNVLIAATALGLTVQFMLGEWRFCFADGFTRRDAR